MTTLQQAQARYIKASTAISRTFDPTDEQWDEMDAAAADYYAAQQAEAEAGAHTAWHDVEAALDNYITADAAAQVRAAHAHKLIDAQKLLTQ